MRVGEEFGLADAVWWADLGRAVGQHGRLKGASRGRHIHLVVTCVPCLDSFVGGRKTATLGDPLCEA